MKKDFERPPTAEELFAVYKEREKANPASIYYERKLVRPSLNFGRIFIFVITTLVLAVIVAFFMQWAFKLLWLSILSCCLVVIVAVIIFLKRILIWLIKAYQRFAPKKIRERCRYEPSCSQYMILAIEKYGLKKGLKKGLKRWKSCKPPNGGYDMP